MKLRFKDLQLHAHDAPKSLENRFKGILNELEHKEILFHPHFWCSDEWFCPDGIAGIAVPFYLYHPVLRELERSFMGKVEGETKREFEKLLRHEIGHAMDNAYGLRRLKSRQKLFGLTSTEYPESYLRPSQSSDYVDYLGDGYASSHPDEDWAETFATWLDPHSNWSRKYSGLALKKLQYVDQLMRRLKGREPKHMKRVYWCTRNINVTLGEYYQEKIKRFKIKEKQKLLNRISSSMIDSVDTIPGTQFLKQNRRSFDLIVKKVTSNDIDFSSPLFNDLYTHCKNQSLHFKKNTSFDFLDHSHFKKSIENHYSRISI